MVDQRRAPLGRHVRELGRGLVTLRESPARLRVAANAGVAIALPIVILTLAGRPDLGLMASSGGFLALYLPYRPVRDRARWLPLIAMTLLAGAALGVVTAPYPALAPWALGLAVVVVSSVGFGLRLGPPGAVFFILISGVSGQLVASPVHGGRGLSGWQVLGTMALGMGIAYLIVILPLALPRTRAREDSIAGPPVPVALDFDAPSRIIIGRIALSVLLASVLCLPLGVHRYYWVVLTLVVILQNGHRVSLTVSRAIQRVAGTVAGLGLFALLAPLHLQGLWLALFVGLLQFTVEMVVTRNYGLALLVITPLAMTIAAQGHTGDVGSLVRERVLDTVIGAAIAMGVLLITQVLSRLRRTR